MSETDAQACLISCLLLFRQLDDAAGADACLRALKAVGRPPSAALHAEGLTRRERQVAGLVAAGFNNREIGEALTISRGTARRHVTNILAKLGFHSRTQIATWFAEHRRPHA
jgi:non-specific serine/threonine protein kinase